MKLKELITEGIFDKAVKKISLIPLAADLARMTGGDTNKAMSALKGYIADRKQGKSHAQALDAAPEECRTKLSIIVSKHRDKLLPLYSNEAT